MSYGGETASHIIARLRGALDDARRELRGERARREEAERRYDRFLGMVTRVKTRHLATVAAHRLGVEFAVPRGIIGPDEKRREYQEHAARGLGSRVTGEILHLLSGDPPPPEASRDVMEMIRYPVVEGAEEEAVWGDRIPWWIDPAGPSRPS